MRTVKNRGVIPWEIIKEGAMIIRITEKLLDDPDIIVCLKKTEMNRKYIGNAKVVPKSILAKGRVKQVPSKRKRLEDSVVTFFINK